MKEFEFKRESFVSFRRLLHVRLLWHVVQPEAESILGASVPSPGGRSHMHLWYKSHCQSSWLTMSQHNPIQPPVSAQGIVHVHLDLQVMFPKEAKHHKHLSWVRLREKTKCPLFYLGFKERAQKAQKRNNRSSLQSDCRSPSPSSNGQPAIFMTWWQHSAGHSDSGDSSGGRVLACISFQNTLLKHQGKWVPDFPLIVILILVPHQRFFTGGVPSPHTFSLSWRRDPSLFYKN